jgi:hypothetical protein
MTEAAEKLAGRRKRLPHSNLQFADLLWWRGRFRLRLTPAMSKAG